MFPEYNDKRLGISFLIPVGISLGAAIFKENYLISFLISIVDIMFFWLVILLAVGLITRLKKKRIENRWKMMMFLTNLVILPLLIIEILNPGLYSLRDAMMPKGSDWDSIGSVHNDLFYKTLIILPTILFIVAAGLIVALLSLSIYESQRIDTLKCILIAQVSVIMAFFLADILAGLVLVAL